MRVFWAAPLVLASALDGRAQTVTFAQDIAPIIYSNCSGCHHPGEIAPFSLLSYSDVAKRGITITTVTQSRYMPPWKPEPGWQKYRDQRGLTTAQIALIQQWVDQGLPEGDESKAPPVPQFPDGWRLGTPDLVLTMPAGFSVPADGPDLYRNFVIHTNLAQDKWVTAIEMRPASPTVVHHSLFFSDSTGDAAKLDGQDGQPGFPGFGTIFTVGNPLNNLNGGLGAWVPGSTPQFLPQGIAVPLPAGSDFLLQTHFHPDGAAHTEQTTIGLYFGQAPARSLTQIQVPAFFGVQSNLRIPAGDANYRVRGTFTLPADVDAVGVWAHAHYLAKEAKMTATLPDGSVQILLWIRNWSFNWQDQYLFQNLIPLPKGTRLDGEVTWDNSAANVSNPNSPPRVVNWGENSTDEMGSLILNVLPKNQADLGTIQGATIAYVLTPVPLVGSKPLLISSDVLDGAANQPGSVTPGKIVVIYGERLGPASLANASLAPDGRLSTNDGGTQVLFDGIPAPMLYSTSGQVGAIAPFGLDGKIGTQVQVQNGKQISDPVALPVAATAPSIFSVDLSGTGPAAILNQDGLTVNSAANPAARGSVISIYATGGGQTIPPGVDGLLSFGPAFPQLKLQAQVSIDGQPADVVYAGAAPGSVAGLLQVNARVPAAASSGAVSIQVQVGDAVSQSGMTMVVK